MSNDNIQIDIIVNLQGLESIQKLQGAFRGVQDAVGRTTKKQQEATDGNFKNIKSWGQLSAHLSTVERDLDAVWRAGVHLKALGSDMLGISRDIIGTGVEIVDMYREYDYWLRRAGVALNTNAEWQGKVDEAIQKTAISVGLLKPEEVAEAFNVWGAATGVVVDDMDTLNFVTDAVTKAIIATAGAGGSLEGNLKGIAAVLGQFNMNMGEAGHVTEVLTLMTERTQADFGDLASAFSYVGPLAHSLGVTFDDVAQILGALADSGQKGSRAGRGLSMVIEGLSAPSEKAAGALDLVVNGFKKGKREWKDVAFPKGDFIGMEAVVVELAKGLYGATDAQRGYVYSTAFSNNATRALIPLVERTIELWRKDKKALEEHRTILDEQKYSLEGAGAYFANMTKTMTESINAVIGSFKNSFFPIIQLVAIRIMELAGPVLNQLKVAISAVGDWLKANPWAVDLAVKIGAIIAIVTGLAGVFFTLIGTFILLGAGVAFFLKGLSGIVFAFTILGGIVGGLVAAIVQNVGGIRDELGRLGAEMGQLLAPAVKAFDDFSVRMGDIPSLLGPAAEAVITALADAIGWLADRLNQINNDPVLSGIIRTFAVGLGILLGWIATVKTIGTLIGSVSSGLWAAARAFNFIKTGLMALVALPGPLKIVGVILAAIGALFYAYENNIAGFKDLVDGIIKWATTEVPKFIAAAEQWVSGVVSNLQAGVGAAVAWFNDVLVPAVTTAWNQLVSIVSGIVSTVMGVLGPIMDPIVRLITVGIPSFVTKVQELWAAISPVLASLAQTFIDVMGQIWHGIMEVVGAVGNLIATFVEHLGPIIGPLIEIIATLVGYLWDVFIPVWNILVTVVGAVVGAIVAAVMWFIETVVGIVGPFLEGLLNIFGTVFGAIAHVISEILDAISQIIAGVMTAISKGINVVLSIIKGDWGAAWRGIWEFIGYIVGSILGIVGTFLSNIVNAVAEWLPKVVTWFVDTFNGIIDFIGKLPGQVFDLAIDIIAGLIDGALSMVGEFIKTFKSFGEGVINWIANTLGMGKGGKGLPSTLIDIGVNIIKGLVQGVLNMIGWAADQIGGAIGGLIDGLKDGLGIKSPSTVFAEIGRYMIEGMAVGFNETDSAVKAMSDLTGTLVSMSQSGADRVNMALENSLSGSLGGVSVTSDNKKTIVLQVEVTSPDGSVSQLDAAQLADLIKGPDLVSALEHMAANV